MREYAERVLGLNGRQTEERLRVGRALVELPRLDAALAAGELCWSVVRELTRVAVADTEEAWVSFALGMRYRDVERALARRAPGETPEDPGDAARVAHRLRFEVQAETMAAVRDAQAALGRELGHAVDDDTFLLSVMRAFLAGPPRNDDGTEHAGRAVYQVAVSRCDVCRATSMEAGGEVHEVSDAVAEMVACDAQDIGTVDGAGPRAGAPAPSASPKAAASPAASGAAAGDAAASRSLCGAGVPSPSARGGASHRPPLREWGPRPGAAGGALHRASPAHPRGGAHHRGLLS